MSALPTPRKLVQWFRCSRKQQLAKSKPNKQTYPTCSPATFVQTVQSFETNKAFPCVQTFEDNRQLHRRDEDERRYLAHALSHVLCVSYRPPCLVHVVFNCQTAEFRREYLGVSDGFNWSFLLTSIPHSLQLGIADAHNCRLRRHHHHNYAWAGNYYHLDVFRSCLLLFHHW